MARSNKDVVLEYVAAFNRGDLDGLCGLFTPDAQVHGVLGWGGLDVVRPIWEQLIRCFEMQLHVEDMIAEGDVVAVRYTERGRSAQSFRGGPVTGRPYDIAAMEWFVIRDGRIHRRWGARDSAAMSRQMGLPIA